MEKKWLEWSIMAPAVLMTLAIIGAVIYLMTPTVLAAIAASSGIGPGSCEFPGIWGEICMVSQTYLGSIIMILLVLAGAVSVVAWIVAAIDVLALPGLSGGERALWFIVVALFWWAGPAIYYVVKKRDRK